MGRPIDAETLRAHIAYNPETGEFSRIQSRTHNAGVGRDANGYVRFMVCGCSARGQVWAYLYMTGEWPSQEMDHINGDVTDNRWSNLRHVAHAINMQNRRRAHRNNSTGFLGVTRSGRRFIATVGHERIGAFATAQDAHDAYVKAKRVRHPGCTL